MPSRAPRYALSAIFTLLTLQGIVSLALRVLGGESDRVHPALHAASGIAGLALLAMPRLQARYAIGFGAAYLALGALGALLMVSPSWLPLGPVDHAFHVALGGATAAAGALAARERVA